MIKCPLCDEKFNQPEDLHGHLEDEHIDSIPKNFTPSQYMYYIKTGKEHGSCVICKSPTTWNEVSGKYNRFCEIPSHKCKEKYREEFRKRMIGKYGKIHLLNDPQQQRKMLANRSISGTYKWADGSAEKQYTGTYEKDFLQFLDVLMNWDPEDIFCPSPHTYYYEYEGEKKFYIPDVFLASINTEIEIKDGGDNPNMHHKIQDVDKVKEKLKDEVLMSQKSFNFIKIVNKEYEPFFELLLKLKKQYKDTGDKNVEPIFIVREGFSLPQEEDEPSIDSNTLEPEKKPDDVKEIYNAVYESASFVLNNIMALVTNRVDFVEVISTFKDMRQQMMQMVKDAKTLDDIKFLKKDKDNVKRYLNNLKKADPRLKDACTEHIQWIDSVYTIAITDKEELLTNVKHAEDKKFNRPFTPDEVKQTYGEDIYKRLMNDPVHKWRAENGIELIHQEPSLQEFERIWTNWNNMNDEQKKISNLKSIEFFGVDNQTNYKKLKQVYSKAPVKESAENDDKTKQVDDYIKPVYVFLTYTDTLMAKLIKFHTGDPYSHASISFDSTMNELYSFGRKTKDSFVSFIQEDIKEGLFKDLQDNANYSVYVFFVDNTHMELMQDKLNEFKEKADKLKFSFMGLFNVAMGKETHRENEFFCSQFVAEMMKAGKPEMIKKDPSLYSPYSLINNKNIFFVDRGKLKNYDKSKVERKTEELKKQFMGNK